MTDRDYHSTRAREEAERSSLATEAAAQKAHQALAELHLKQIGVVSSDEVHGNPKMTVRKRLSIVA